MHLAFSRRKWNPWRYWRKWNPWRYWIYCDGWYPSYLVHSQTVDDFYWISQGSSEKQNQQKTYLYDVWLKWFIVRNWLISWWRREVPHLVRCHGLRTREGNCVHHCSRAGEGWCPRLRRQAGTEFCPFVYFLFSVGPQRISWCLLTLGRAVHLRSLLIQMPMSSEAPTQT